MKPYPVVIFIFIITFTINITNSISRENNVPEEKSLTNSITTKPEIIKISDNILKVGDILIDIPTKAISMQGEVNMSDGLVEYLACTAEGKLHESVLKVNADPFHIQISLLLLGLKPGNRPIDFQGAPQTPCGAPVKILVSWDKNGEKKEYLAEQLIENRALGQTVDKMQWVFTGSVVMDGHYMAQMEGTVAAIFHDPSALFDHTLDSGNDDTLFFANKKVLPVPGTPITFKIIAETDPDVIKKTLCDE